MHLANNEINFHNTLYYRFRFIRCQGFSFLFSSVVVVTAVAAAAVELCVSSAQQINKHYYYLAERKTDGQRVEKTKKDYG